MKNLANKLRPETLDDVVGQKEVVSLLKKVASNKLTNSFIFFGESGVGKTSCAIALANDLELKYELFNASVDKKEDLIKGLQNNELLIIDEIHRLNKDKQDILLSFLELDKVTIYATTTENPYFKINPALRSRMQILQFNKLSEEEMFYGIKNILKKHYSNLIVEDKIIKILIKNSGGDYRFCINNLQMIALLNKDNKITENDLKSVIPNINFYSDKDSTSHYNNLSAFHKSLRGSDVDAALYYGTILLKSGDIEGLFRRLTACAYEDIGLADPNIGLKIEAAYKAFERLGLPEARLPIYYSIITIALTPKSNTIYESINKIEEYVNQGNIFEVPLHLRDGHYSSASKLGIGNYIYPHDYPRHFVKQKYLPKQVKQSFFEPCENDSKKIKEYYNFVKNEFNSK
ncbi:replication-associated recombination protein A [Mycoplasma sp. Mirounga ES2805-ORL]|uniref:replication-associated recombination protein A n=1 Tax=Mycoplasma sp. Mirounga ES2805-ORL TaxID=754514 RepID=UPI00197BDBA4|nr:replication-associated recombination protein A [Mycoplasma sp. Mirounga ES2805-ORL]QSF13672.1 replication-associated recombination protein A [Mycoplasma sp. Mirounga ES2805-ORL]